MSPTLHLGDMVIAAKVSPDSIREGDIIEFLQGQMRVIHRVIDIEDSGGSRQFITKGDANDSPDIDPVSPSQVKGKAMFSVPKVGWVVLVLRRG
jgi:signal peptidase